MGQFSFPANSANLQISLGSIWTEISEGMSPHDDLAVALAIPMYGGDVHDILVQFMDGSFISHSSVIIIP